MQTATAKYWHLTLGPLLSIVTIGDHWNREQLRCKIIIISENRIVSILPGQFLKDGLFQSHPLIFLKPSVLGILKRWQISGQESTHNPTVKRLAVTARAFISPCSNSIVSIHSELPLLLFNILNIYPRLKPPNFQVKNMA